MIYRFIFIFYFIFFSFASLSQKENGDLKLKKNGERNFYPNTKSDLKKNKNESEKKPSSFSLDISHTYLDSLIYNERAVLSHGFDFSYKLKKDVYVNSSLAYQMPFVHVFDDSNYGFTDLSLSTNALDLITLIPKKILHFNLKKILGISFPLSKKSRKNGKLFSVFTSLSYGSQDKNINFEWFLNHIFYYSFHLYESDISGFIPNKPFFTSHSLSISSKYFKPVALSMTGRLDFFYYFRDLDSNPDINTSDLEFRHSHGFSLQAIYPNILKNISLRSSVHLNIPGVSFILTGSPLTNQNNWSYTLGIDWNI